MSLPTLPTSEHDIVVPLPDQNIIDSRLKHLRGHPHRQQQRTPAGFVVDPIELLRCVGGSDSPFNTHNTTTYSHREQEVNIVTSTTTSQAPVFSFGSLGEGEGHHTASSLSSQEKNTPEGSRVVEHFEVEPHARSVLTFRRNSLRQFSSLMEENEDKETSSYPPPTGGTTSAYATPLFVISDGIRRTYFPGQQSQTHSKQEDTEYTDTNMAVYGKVSSPALMRKIQSFPELSSLAEPDMPVAKFPTPTIKVTKHSDKSHSSVSIFSSFAGELRSQVRATVRQPPSNQSTVALHENKTVVQSEKDGLKIDSVKSDSPPVSPGKVEVSEVKMSVIPDEKPKKKSFMKSLMKWGTESKVTVSNKETNMYSPGSF